MEMCAFSVAPRKTVQITMLKPANGKMKEVFTILGKSGVLQSY